jgi:hypothetical protein
MERDEYLAGKVRRAPGPPEGGRLPHAWVRARSRERSAGVLVAAPTKRRSARTLSAARCGTTTVAIWRASASRRSRSRAPTGTQSSSRSSVPRSLQIRFGQPTAGRRRSREQRVSARSEQQLCGMSSDWLPLLTSRSGSPPWFRLGPSRRPSRETSGERSPVTGFSSLSPWRITRWSFPLAGGRSL